MNQTHYQCFKIFIASPGDVQTERHLAEETIKSINNTCRETLGLLVECLNWEALPPFAASPTQGGVQDIIIDRLVNQCNAFVLILNKRSGTVAPGWDVPNTQREIDAAFKLMQEGKNIMFLAYFRNLPPNADPGKEERKVRSLRQQLEQKELLYKPYDTPEDFRSRLTHDLYQTILSFMVSTSKRRALERFWQLGIPEGKDGPALAIIYPPLDRVYMYQETPDQIWLTRLVPHLVFEDFRAIQKIEKTLQLIGFKHYHSYSESTIPNDIDDMNRLCLCIPRNNYAFQQLAWYKNLIRFNFTKRMPQKEAVLSWNPLGSTEWFKISSPLNKYLQIQRQDCPGGNWTPEHGRIVAKDFAILARFTARRQRGPMVQGTLKDYFLAGIRGLGTWGAGWFIDRKYDELEKYTQNEDSTIQILLEVIYYNDRILDVRDVSNEPESYFRKENQSQTINQHIKNPTQ
jgi:hypothetical protein